jgi:hypothetical protein
MVLMRLNNRLSRACAVRCGHAQCVVRAAACAVCGARGGGAARASPKLLWCFRINYGVSRFETLYCRVSGFARALLWCYGSERYPFICEFNLKKGLLICINQGESEN